MSDGQTRELPSFRESPHFSSIERLVLEYAEEMTRTPVAIPEALFTSLRSHFNEAQMVELTATIAWENHRAQFDHAFGIESAGLSMRAIKA